MLQFILAFGCSPKDNVDVPLSPSSVETAGGLYELHLEANPDPFVAGESSKLTIESDEQAVVTSVTPYMPDMGHGISAAPDIEEDDGAYVASWVFTMPGYWELTIEVEATGGVDEATVAYDVD